MKLSTKVKLAYKHYFEYQVGDQDKRWAPHICCNRCKTGLLLWLDGKRKAILFAVPMIWREQSNHHSDCYFCMTNIKGFSGKNKSKIEYPVCPSALLPVIHSSDIAIPLPPSGEEEFLFSDGPVSSEESTNTEMEASFVDERRPLFINQDRLDDLVRDLSLSKEKAELLGSRLQQWNLLESRTTICLFRDRSKKLSRFFTTDAIAKMLTV